MRQAPVHSAAMDACLPPGAASHLASRGGCALAPCGGRTPTPWRGVAASARGVGTVGSHPSRPPSSGPPLCHDGTARPIPRPNEPTEQQTGYRGKQKRPRLPNLLRIDVAWRILCLRATHPGSVHDKRLADTTPSPRRYCWFCLGNVASAVDRRVLRIARPVHLHHVLTQ